MPPDQRRVCKPPTEAGLASLRPKKSFRAIFARKPQLLDILPESHPQKTSSPRNASRKSPGHEVFTVRHCRSGEVRPANKLTFFANSAKNFARLDKKASPPQREEPLPPQRKTLLTLARELCPPGEENSFSPGGQPSSPSSEKNRSDGKAYSPWRERRLATTSTRRRATSRLLIRGSSTSSSAVTSHTSLSSVPKASPSPT